MLPQFEEWAQIPARHLPDYEGCRVSLRAPDSTEVPDRLTYAVERDGGVDLATRDGRFTLTPENPVWVQRERPPTEEFPTVPSPFGDQHILPI